MDEKRIAERVARALKAEGQYDSLNDAAAATGNPGYALGLTLLFYMKPATWRDLSLGYDFAARNGRLPDPDDLYRTHVLLGGIKERNLNRVFAMMQGEAWSPGGEANRLIRANGLHHTSMSVGDVVTTGRGRVYMVDMAGFVNLVDGTKV